MTDLDLTKEPVTDEHAKDVCKIGAGNACCRYLTMGINGWSCEKHSSLAGLLDQRVKDNTITAQGDNCEGRLSR